MLNTQALVRARESFSMMLEKKVGSNVYNSMRGPHALSHQSYDLVRDQIYDPVQ